MPDLTAPAQPDEPAPGSAGDQTADPSADDTLDNAEPGFLQALPAFLDAAAEVLPPMTAFLPEVASSVWDRILSQMTVKNRTSMLRSLGLPSSGAKRIPPRVVTDLPGRLGKSSAAAERELRWLMEHPAEHMRYHAVLGRPCSEHSEVVEDKYLMATAALSRAANGTPDLPMILSWLQDQFPETFELLMPDEASRSCLETYLEAARLDSPGWPVMTPENEEEADQLQTLETTIDAGHGNGTASLNGAAPDDTAAATHAATDAAIDAEDDDESVDESEDDLIDSAGHVSVVERPGDGEQEGLLMEVVRAAVETALVSCRATLGRLEQGHSPLGKQIADLTAARDALNSAADDLSRQLGSPVEPELAALDAAAVLLSAGSSTLLNLQRLLGAQSIGAQAAAALAVAIEMNQTLLDQWPPADDAGKKLAAELERIVKLIALASADDADTDAVFEEQRALEKSTEPQLHPLLKFAVMGRVTLPTTAEPAASEQPAAMPAPVPSPAVVAAAPTTPEPTPAPAATLPPAPAAAIPDDVADPVETDSATPGAATAEPDRIPAPEPSPAPALEPVTAAAPAAAAPKPNVAATPKKHAPAAHAGKPQVDIAADTRNGNDAVLERAAQWISDGQYALASHLLKHSSPGLAAAAQLCALANAAHGPNGPHELELNTLAVTENRHALVDGSPARFLTTAALLLGTAVTGSMALGNLLVDLADHLDRDSSPVAQAVGEGARTGAFVGTGLGALTSIPADQALIQHAVAAVEERKLAGRTNRFPRAVQVLNRLRAPEDDPAATPTTVGGCLEAAANDRRVHVAEVADLLTKFSRTTELSDRIDQDDRDYRAAGAGKPIVGNVRQEMLTVLRDDISAIAQWVSAVQQVSLTSTPDYFTGQISTVRQVLLNDTGAFLELLDQHRTDTDPLIAAAATAAHRLVTKLLDLLHGRITFKGAELDVRTTLELCLLALPDAHWDVTKGVVLAVGDDPESLEQALLALPVDIDAGAILQARYAQDDFRAAEQVIAHMLPASLRESALADLIQRRTDRISMLQADLQVLQMDLTAVTTVAEDDNGAKASSAEHELARELERVLNALKDPDPELLTASQLSRSARGRLKSLQGENKNRVRGSLAKLRAIKELRQQDVARVEQRIDAGKLDLASDDIETLRSRDSLFEEDEHLDLEQCFPLAIEALPTGIDVALIEAVRNDTAHPLLTDVTMSSVVREGVLEGLEAWRGLRTAFNDGWKPRERTDQVAKALRQIGVSTLANDYDQLEGKRYTYARGRRFLEVKNANLTGYALIPAFGSSARGRYRILLVWNNPTAAEIDQWREADDSHLPLLVCYLGTMPMAQRLELSALWSDPSRRPTIVIDDAVLAWVATHGRSFDRLMRLTLPFTSTQPFVPEKRPDVPIEMFYGRARESRELQNQYGPSIVYGGRGLGKSALLTTIEQGKANDDDFKVVWFEVDRIAGIPDSPELLWGELASKLESKGVVPGPRASKTNQKEWVEKAVKAFTDQPGKRILILLDEAEGFFNADAPRFADVRRLYQLSAATQFNCKVVFSGLHSVQHYYTAGNNPFSPTGALQIGPLNPQDAYRLLTRPLAALGYLLSIEDAQRIILHCNAQPYLIQMVAYGLLNEQLASRADSRIPVLPPPWTVSPGAVTRVLNDPELRNNIRRAFALTLDIDKRTRVIASLLALHMLDSKPGERMPDGELYDACRAAWPDGFEHTTQISFRELLSELAGLGLLADTDDEFDGRTLRNETVLRALGSRQELLRHLAETRESAMLDQEARGHVRFVRKDGQRRSPLTTNQLGPLFRKSDNTVCVIVGSEATGILDVSDSLHEAQPELVDLRTPGTFGSFKSALEEGATDSTRMLVVSELYARTDHLDTCQKSLELARGDDGSGAGLPKSKHASRAVALVAGLNNVSWLLELAAQPDADSLVVPLERYNKVTLPLRWRDEGQLDEFGDHTLCAEALELTSGFPELVEELAAKTRQLKSPQKALASLREKQTHPEWCAAFLQRSGAVLESYPDMAQFIGVLVDYGLPCSPADVSLLTDDHVANLEQTAKLARWLGLVSENQSGDLVLAPVVATCWRTGKLTAD